MAKSGEEVKCSECTHWQRKDRDDIQGTGVGVCKKVKMFWDCTEWSEHTDDRVFTEEAKDDLAFVQDGSDYHAVLMTLPDFGCIQFEEA